ncbi:MAG: PHP domain-containing protein [Treponema sp.]|nr:PHP domain-containing protein [Treponema sp.]
MSFGIMSKVDLHIHSRFSRDGEIPVSRILEMCTSTGMKLISITDHNSVEGVSEALEKTGIEVVSGVELDCIYKGLNLHLLGYGFDHTNKAFLKIEEDILDQEKDAGEKRIRLFQKATGIPLDIEEILNSENADIVGGELIGEHALAIENAEAYDVLKPYLPGGEKTDMPYVRIYWDFFAPGKPAYVPIQYISLPDAIKLIHETNGITVLAHPGQNLSGNYHLLPDIISEGLDGIEVYSSYHSAEDAVYFLDIAGQNNLLVSCGSDFHGKNKPAIQLGGHGARLDDEEIISSFHSKLIGGKNEFIN